MDLVVGKSFYFDFEVVFMQWLQSLLGEKGAMAVSHFSAFGEEMLLIGILGFIFWCYDKKYGTYIGINVMVGLVLNPLIKNIYSIINHVFKINCSLFHSFCFVNMKTSFSNF